MAKVKLALKEAGIEAESLKGEPPSFLPFFPARSLSVSLSFSCFAFRSPFYPLHLFFISLLIYVPGTVYQTTATLSKFQDVGAKCPKVLLLLINDKR